MKNCGDSLLGEQLELIPQASGGAIPTSPLQLHIKEIAHATAHHFYTTWHYLGETQFLSSVNYGAFFDGALVGSISYGPPNAKTMNGLYDAHSQKGWWEIKRLAMAQQCPKNSESRFIAISLKLLRASHQVDGLITLADDGVGHRGTTYKGLTAPKTDYVVNGKKIQRGKVAGMGGQWVPRSRKHVYFKKFKEPNA